MDLGKALEPGSVIVQVGDELHVYDRGQVSPRKYRIAPTELVALPPVVPDPTPPPTGATGGTDGS
jgi:hypothetical protein